MNLGNFKHILLIIKTEVSLVPYYHGGVLFPELNNYLNSYNLYTKIKPQNHCDLVYLR